MKNEMGAVDLFYSFVNACEVAPLFLVLLALYLLVGSEVRAFTYIRMAYEH